MTQKVRAFTYTKYKPQAEQYGRVTHVSIPGASSLKPRQALIQVHYAAINPIDYKLPDSAVASAVTRLVVPGQDFSGRVVAVGSGWTRTDVRVGSLVFGRLDLIGQHSFHGSLAEMMVVPSEAVAALATDVDLRSAAGFGCAGLTAFQSIVPYARSLKATRVFINGGSGGTGTWGIQIARAIGLHVTTTCSTSNVELCRSLGADVVIDYTSTNVVDALACADAKFDFAVDNVGAAAALYDDATRFLQPNAPFIQVGVDASLDTLASLTKRLLVPAAIAGYRWKFSVPRPRLEDFQEAGQWMSEGKIRCVIAAEMPLDDAKEAFSMLRRGRTKGKILIRVHAGEEGSLVGH